MNYEYVDDIKLILEILELSREDLANDLEIDIKTLNRWINETNGISESNLEKIYEYAYKDHININRIKEMLSIYDNKSKVLFHGSKKTIEGEIDINRSDDNNDFGKGFYLSETLEAAATFVSSFEKSSIYRFTFENTDLKCVKFDVSTEWMIAIAYYRGRINEYVNNDIVKNIVNKVDEADFIIAPIADNRMFRIINDFIDKMITDEQCKHCLSATNLGFQYVIKSKKAINHLKMIGKDYLCTSEKKDYLEKRRDFTKLGDDKVKAARVKYRGKGKYIDELLR